MKIPPTPKKSKPAPAPRRATKSKAAGPAPEADDAEPVGSQVDFDAFLPLARALPAHEIRPMRADLVLALQNAQMGHRNVFAERERLEALPETNVAELDSIVALVQATIYADTQIPRAMPASELRKKLAVLRALRRLLLKTADTLAEAGLIPKAEVDKIREGQGDIDAAKDCVALAALFTKYAAKVRGKHAVTAAQIKQAGELGAELLKSIKPVRAKRAKASVKVEAVDRDRLWTLVEKRHDQLWRGGAYLFGRAAADEKVPPLQASRSAGPREKKAGSTDKPGAKPPATP